MLIALDWFILVILLGGLVRGYTVGAVRQVASLIGLLAALLFSVEFMRSVGALIVSSLGLSDSLAPLAGFTVLFLGVYLVFMAVSRFLEHALESLSLSVLNRAAGSVVGAFKAALLLSLLFLILGGLELPEQETRTASTLYSPVAQLLPQAIDATSEWFPAAKEAADQLGRQVRSEIEAVPESSAVHTAPPTFFVQRAGAIGAGCVKKTKTHPVRMSLSSTSPCF